jgi:hypothetical protein
MDNFLCFGVALFNTKNGIKYIGILLLELKERY